jgi:hypothetical protein
VVPPVRAGYHPDCKDIRTADPSLTSLWKVLLRHCEEAVGKGGLTWQSLVFSIMPCTHHVFDTWIKMRSPSAIFVRQGLKACFLTAFCDAYIRGWLPLFECPEEWSNEQRPDVICQRARDGIAAGDSVVEEVASVPLLGIDDDEKSDIVREERHRFRNMITQWVARPSLIAADIDCDQDGDMYATLGPALRGVTMATADEWDMPSGCSHIANVPLHPFNWKEVADNVTQYMTRIGVRDVTAIRTSPAASRQSSRASSQAARERSHISPSVSDSGLQSRSESDEDTAVDGQLHGQGRVPGRPFGGHASASAPARATRSQTAQTLRPSWPAAVSKLMPEVGPCAILYPGQNAIPSCLCMAEGAMRISMQGASLTPCVRAMRLQDLCLWRVCRSPMTAQSMPTTWTCWLR